MFDFHVTEFINTFYYSFSPFVLKDYEKENKNSLRFSSGASKISFFKD